jgi:outer membrane protein
VKKFGIGAAAAGMAIVAGAQSEAQAETPQRGYAQLSVVDVAPNPHHIQMFAGGALVPGASFDAPDETSFQGEVGWYIKDSWAVAGSIVTEVETDNVGTGALAGPPLGSDSFMLGAVTLTYHFNEGGMLSPYVGGGASYFHSTGAKDGVVTGLKIDDAWGGVVQAGVNLNITERWGVFVDAKQYLTSIEARGMIAGVIPMAAKADLDPLVVGAGATFRF